MEGKDQCERPEAASGPLRHEEAAARAYDEQAKQLHDDPILNFLPNGSLNPDRHLRHVESRSKQMTNLSVASPSLS